MKPLLAVIGVLVCAAAADVTTVASSASVDTKHVLWRDPGPIAARDLYWGPGSEARAPKPPYTFVAEDVSGTKAKISVKDSAGVSWSVKFTDPAPHRNEVHAEIAATRLVWALGYLVDENYFVREGRIDGVKDLKRAAAVVGADGAFRVARFERRPPEAQKAGDWHIEDNRFRDSRELSGLHALVLLLSSWDYMPGNTVVLRVPLPNGDTEERYVISDLGSTFGRMRGGANKEPGRWDLAAFGAEKYLTGIVLGRLEFRAPLLGNQPVQLPLEHARWFAAMLSQLSDHQIRQAFEASGATPEDVAAFSTVIRKRISDLENVLKQK